MIVEATKLASFFLDSASGIFCTAQYSARLVMRIDCFRTLPMMLDCFRKLEMLLDGFRRLEMLLDFYTEVWKL